MNGLPLLTRELRARSRQWQTWYMRAGVMLVAALTAFGVIGVGLSGGMFPDQVGHLLFQVLVIQGGVCALFAGPLFTADCISSEKREETLGLLFLTPLRGGDIVAAKFTVAMLPAFYALLAYFPILAISFLLGGVTLGEFGRGVMLVSTLLFLSLSIGILASTLCRQALTAMGTTLGLVVILVMLPFWIATDPTQPGPAAFPFVLPSPSFALFLLPDTAYIARGYQFWMSEAAQVLLGLLSLVAAGLALPQIWMRQGLPWRLDQPLFGRCAVVSAYRRHDEIARMSQADWLRRRLLEENPAMWPTARRPIKMVLINTLLCFFLVAVAGAWLFYKDRDAAEDTLVISLIVLHVLIKFWLAMAASRRANEDARSGALELLLITPLTEHKIIQGWLLGLKRTFIVPVTFLVLANLTMCFLNLDSLILTMGLLLMLLADLYTLAWVGLWMGVRARTPAAATVRTLGLVLWLPWSVVLLCGALSLLDVNTDLVMSLAVGGYFIFSYFADLLLCVLVPPWLVRDFRRGDSPQARRV